MCLYTHAGLAALNFTQFPMNIEIHPESSEGIAAFPCQHDTAPIITWIVNNTASSNIDVDVGIMTCTSPLPNGPPLHTLKIPSDREYNMTEVVCVALFRDGSPTQTTPPVYLILQGSSCMHCFASASINYIYQVHMILTVLCICTHVCHLA